MKRSLWEILATQEAWVCVSVWRVLKKLFESYFVRGNWRLVRNMWLEADNLEMAGIRPCYPYKFVVMLLLTSNSACSHIIIKAMRGYVGGWFCGRQSKKNHFFSLLFSRWPWELECWVRAVWLRTCALKKSNYLAPYEFVSISGQLMDAILGV